MFKRWFEKLRLWMNPPAARSGPITDPVELRDWFEDNFSCPDCKSEHFLEGPSGGISTNIQCAGCGNEFNVAIAMGQIISVERIRYKGN